MVAGARRDDAAGALVRRQMRDLVVGAAQLEAEDRLQVLALEQHRVAETAREARRRIERASRARRRRRGWSGCRGEAW